MTRSVWKGPFIDGFLLKKADKVREGGRNEVQDVEPSLHDPAAVRRSHLRCLQSRVEAYPCTSLRNQDMVGHKFGEFAPTRTYYGHGADKKAKRK